MSDQHKALSETRKEQIRQEILRMTEKYLREGGEIHKAAETAPTKPRQTTVNIGNDLQNQW